MSLVEKLSEAKRSGTGLPCGAFVLLKSLQGEEKKALELIFSTQSSKTNIPNTKLHKILLSEGYDIAFSSLRLHRSQTCRCYTGKNGILTKEDTTVMKVS